MNARTKRHTEPPRRAQRSHARVMAACRSVLAGVALLVVLVVAAVAYRAWIRVEDMRFSEPLLAQYDAGVARMLQAQAAAKPYSSPAELRAAYEATLDSVELMYPALDQRSPEYDEAESQAAVNIVADRVREGKLPHEALIAAITSVTGDSLYDPQQECRAARERVGVRPGFGYPDPGITRACFSSVAGHLDAPFHNAYFNKLRREGIARCKTKHPAFMCDWAL